MLGQRRIGSVYRALAKNPDKASVKASTMDAALDELSCQFFLTGQGMGGGKPHLTILMSADTRREYMERPSSRACGIRIIQMKYICLYNIYHM